MKKLDKDESLKNDLSKKKTDINWHPAFVQALRMHLYDYRYGLEFHTEFPLYSEPLRIDCVVVKKAKDVVIDKTIAAGFKTLNLIEYKSPKDYISVANFHKVYAYACLCLSQKKATESEMTITFVGSRYPRRLIKHLRQKRGYTVEKTAEGVYTVTGDILPIQIIHSRELSADENLWLKSLSDKLDVDEIIRINEAMKRRNRSLIGIYWDVISQINFKKIQEAMKMDGRAEIEKTFEEIGWTAKWEAQGEARGKVIGFAEGKLEIARKMKAASKPLTEIAEFTGLSLEEIEKL